MAIPANTTPKDTAASAAMWRYAPLMFKSSFCPSLKSKAVTVFITTPMAATMMTVIPSTACGWKKRPNASQAIAPRAISNNIADVKEAKMVILRNP